jgi:acetyltransferase-like isoleucine patch superfamily enzyme
MSGVIVGPQAASWRHRIGQSPYVRCIESVAGNLVGYPRTGAAIRVALLKSAWIVFWMRWAGQRGFGRLATRLATWMAPPYRKRHVLAQLYPSGYFSPCATMAHGDLRLGHYVFIGDGVIFYQQDAAGGPIVIEEGVIVQGVSYLETGGGGGITIGAGTTIQPGCQLMGYKSPIRIGREVGIAKNVALYPFDHGTRLGESMHTQPLESRGGITIEDSAWLGTGVIVLSGVRIGKGAVVGAGSVVWKDIPDNAIASGVPARVIRMRGDDMGSSGT